VTGSEHAAIEFRLLGPVEAVRNGSALPLGGPRQRALLALLLIERGRPVSADRLVDELWRGEPPPGATATLPSYVSRLRAAVGATPPITSAASGYRIDVAADEVDAVRFEQLVATGREALERGAIARASERLRAALALWRGQPFAGVGEISALFEEAQRLDELRLLALEARIEADLRAGRAAELVEELEALVVAQPYRERFWHQLMLALYRAERQADALGAYQRARTLLDQELGIEPAEELKALERSILRHDVPPARSPEQRHNLPAPLTSFIGRETELAEVERLLENARLVTLTGVGGVGKTRLAVEAARRALTDFPEAVFVDLANVPASGGVAARVAATLSVREQAGVPIEDQIVGRIGSGRLLLVLDNCEHLREESAAVVSTLLARCPELRVLATSREFLGCEGEAERPVPPLDPSEGLELFLARARAVRPQLREDEQARATVATICSDLDGLPLAIELAAARVRALSLEEIASRLADRFRFLVSWRRLTSARHRTLERAMDWSYDLLSPTEQVLLARLSVFAGGFTLAAAAAVALESSADDALPHLERLVDASLVVPAGRDGTTRYGLLETVRQYGAERLRERGEREVLRERHARYVTDLLERLREEARGDHGRWVETTRGDYDNFLAALAWGRDEGTPDDQLRLAELVWRLWWVRGEFADGREWLESALERGADSDPGLRARALEGAAGLAWAHGDDERAHELADASRALYVELGDPRELGALTILGHVAINRGRYDEAKRLFERTRAIGQRPVDVALSVLNLGSVAQMGGELDESERLYEEARARYEALADRYGVALSKHLGGILAAEDGRYEEAAARVREALPVFLQLDFAQYTWQAVETAAAIARATGDAAECVRLLAAASRLREMAGTTSAPWERVPAGERAAAQAELGDAAFSAAWEEGFALTKEEALERVRSLLER
jgi:predicted ATPase/DNA-binding SARP family transcriptional activator